MFHLFYPKRNRLIFFFLILLILSFVITEQTTISTIKQCVILSLLFHLFLLSAKKRKKKKKRKKDKAACFVSENRNIELKKKRLVDCFKVLKKLSLTRQKSDRPKLTALFVKNFIAFFFF